MMPPPPQTAWFTTGLELVFPYGVQTSSDLLRFGGWFNGDAAAPVVKWSAPEDVPRVDYLLRELEKVLDRPPFDFSVFPTNLAGTQALLASFPRGSLTDSVVARYRMGCAIRHQLMYAADVRASLVL